MRLLYSGWNGFGQVPQQADKLIRLTPYPMPEPISSVSCSWSTLCIVTGSRLLVSGFLDGKADSSATFTLENKDIIEHVVNNSKHIIALSQSKTLWRRSTALNQQSSQFSVLPIGEMATEEGERDSVKKIFCSDDICLALTLQGNLYAIPSKVSDPSFVVTDMACGNEHTVFITATGSVYTYGQGSRGQLGHGELEAEDEPREVDALAGLRIKHVGCGGWHCAVISEEGDLYTWGWNRFGQLGLKCGTPESSPEVLRPESPRHRQDQGTSVTFTEGGGTTASQCDDGSGGVYALPQLVAWTEKRVVSVSCGSRHTAALLEDGSLWGCGWNAYGQLGTSSILFPQTAFMSRIPLPSDSSGQIQKVLPDNRK